MNGLTPEERDRAGQERQRALAEEWNLRRASREPQQASVAQLEDQLHDSLAGWREPPPRIVPRPAGPGVMGMLSRILRDPGVLFGPDEPGVVPRPAEPGVVPRPAERGSIGDQVARAHPMDSARDEVIRRYHGGLLPGEGGIRVDDPGPPVGSVVPRRSPTAPGQDFGQPGYRPQPLVRSPIRRTSGWTPERIAASAKKYRDFKADVLDRWNALGDAHRSIRDTGEPGIFGEEGTIQDPEGAAAADAVIQAIENETANNPYRRSSREMDERGANLAIPGPVLPTNAQAEYDPETGFFPRITRGGKYVPPGRPRTGNEIVDLGGRNNPKALRMLIREGGAAGRAAQQALNAWRRNYEAELGGGGVAPDGGLIGSLVSNRGAGDPKNVKRAKKTLDALLAGEKPELSTGRRGGRAPTWTPPERPESTMGMLGRILLGSVVPGAGEPGGTGLWSVASEKSNAQKQKDARDARAAVKAERMQKRRDINEAKARGRSDANRLSAQAAAIRAMGPEGAQHFLGNLNKQQNRDATIKAAQIAADANRDVAKTQFPGKTPAEIAAIEQATSDAAAAAARLAETQERNDHPIMQRIQILSSFLAREGLSSEQAQKYEAEILALYAEWRKLKNPDAPEYIVPGGDADVGVDLGPMPGSKSAPGHTGMKGIFGDSGSDGSLPGSSGGRVYGDPFPGLGTGW